MRKRFDIIKNEDSSSAKIYLYGPIGSEYFDGVDAEDFVRQLHALEVEQINLRVNSPGGSVFDGWAIANALATHPAEIIVDVDGLSASIATIITLQGDQINMAKNSRFMIHNAYAGVSGAIGSADELEDYADSLKKFAADLRSVNDDIVEAYVASTGIEEGQIREWMNEETFFNASDTVEHGFAHEVTKKARVVAAKWDSEKYCQGMAAYLAEYPKKEAKKEEKPEDLGTPLRDQWDERLTLRNKTS